MRFSIDRRWATLMVAVLLGAGGGSLLGFVTAPAPGDDGTGELAPAQQVASSTTRRKRGRFAGVSSTTMRPRPRRLPAATAGLSPGTTSTTSTVRPTTTTRRPTTTAVEPSTTTTTTGGDTTTSSSGTTGSSTTSTT